MSTSLSADFSSRNLGHDMKVVVVVRVGQVDNRGVEQMPFDRFVATNETNSGIADAVE